MPKKKQNANKKKKKKNAAKNAAKKHAAEEVGVKIAALNDDEGNMAAPAIMAASAIMAAPAIMAAAFGKDDWVKIVGLKQNAPLNGVVARVVHIQHDRVIVMSSQMDRYRVKPENLEALGIVHCVPKLRSVLMIVLRDLVKGFLLTLDGRIGKVPEKQPMPHSLALLKLRTGEEFFIGFAERQLGGGYAVVCYDPADPRFLPEREPSDWFGPDVVYNLSETLASQPLEYMRWPAICGMVLDMSAAVNSATSKEELVDKLERAVRTHCVTPFRIVPCKKVAMWQALPLDDATLALPNTVADDFDQCSFRVLLFRIACWMEPGKLPDFMQNLPLANTIGQL